MHRWHPWFPACHNHAALFVHTKTRVHAGAPSSCISRSIKGSQGSIMTHCSGIEGHWWPGLIVSEPCLPGWTESLDLHQAHPCRHLCLDTGDKRAMHMLILRPKTDWSLSTQIPAEERHYYLCSGAQWHISKRHCGGWTKSLGVCVYVHVCVWLSLLITVPSQWQKRWAM